MSGSAAHIGDDTLVARIRSGDRDAFETLFRTHHAGLLRFARVQLRDTSEAEDVIHDVFLRLWRGRAELDVRGSLRSYLLGAVRNRVIDLVRHHEVEARSTDMTPDDAPAWTGSGAPQVVDPAHLAQLDAAIRRAVADLPERCRTAFLLCREHDMTYAETAEVMGVSPATVKTQVARALAALRIALEPFLLLVAAAAQTLH